MKLGILEGKGLQLFGCYQDVDSYLSFLNITFQFIKQVLDDCNSILLISMKQSICCIHHQCTIHKISSKSPKKRTLASSALVTSWISTFFFRNSNAIITVNRQTHSTDKIVQVSYFAKIVKVFFCEDRKFDDHFMLVLCRVCTGKTNVSLIIWCRPCRVIIVPPSASHVTV